MKHRAESVSHLSTCSCCLQCGVRRNGREATQTADHARSIKKLEVIGHARAALSTWSRLSRWASVCHPHVLELSARSNPSTTSQTSLTRRTDRLPSSLKRAK